MHADTHALVTAPAALIALVFTAACGDTTTPTGGPAGTAAPLALSGSVAPAQARPLDGTRWRLVELQSMDDAQGTSRPADPSLYTMHLGADGAVAMRVNCNRATGTWKAEASNDASSGRFEFGPLAGTRALCPPSSLDERLMREASYVRSYLIKDGRLHLSLMADGGIQVWEPLVAMPFEASADAALERAILKANPTYTKDVVDGGGAGRGRYVHAKVDLNGDGRDEMLVYLLGPVFCGTGGCNLQIFTPSSEGYVLVSDLSTSRTPLVVAATRSAGWFDLFKLESGGGAPQSYVKLTFDGTRYVERERMAVAQVPQGLRYLAGDLSFDQGVPLVPADTAAASSLPAAPPPSAAGFSTVCGVTVDGRDYRYRCTVEGAAPGRTGQTTLHFPDNSVTLTWKAAGAATATFAGMAPRAITVSTDGGVTRFPFDDKVYFYASDRATAAAQLKALPR